MALHAGWGRRVGGSRRRRRRRQLRRWRQRLLLCLLSPQPRQVTCAASREAGPGAGRGGRHGGRGGSGPRAAAGAGSKRVSGEERAARVRNGPGQGSRERVGARRPAMGPGSASQEPGRPRGHVPGGRAVLLPWQSCRGAASLLFPCGLRWPAMFPQENKGLLCPCLLRAHSWKLLVLFRRRLFVSLLAFHVKDICFLF